MKRVILLSMIKNEEKIIERCIRSAADFVDAVCIVDTGSTDKTKETVETVFASLTIPTHWAQDIWKNFGHNRSLSFEHAVAFCKTLDWSLSDTYAMLLDADMKWKILDLQKEDLTAEGYSLQQRNSSLRYNNTRLVRLDISWKCVGVTHEYWSGGKIEHVDPAKTYIDDVGDGGAKADKFPRDIRLLTEGLEQDPQNARYMFYLAQTYKDTGNHARAIQWYKKRIQAGGWFEEVWYSYYMIAKCWMLLNNELKMDYWANRAYRNRPSRVEPLYMLAKYYREAGNQWKGFYYCRLAKTIPLSKDSLFVEHDAYGHALEYEYTILHYYVHPTNKAEGLEASIRYINKEYPLSHSVYSNSRFYLEPLGGVIQPLNVPPEGDYIPSSTSCVWVDGRLLLNVRYVNYRIQPDGSYKESLDGKLVDNDKIRTRNAWMFLGDDLHFMKDDSVDAPKRPNHRVVGLEDVRLFHTKDGVRFLATSPEYSYCDKYRMLTGLYDWKTSSYRGCVSLKPPTETDCEKNWIPIQDKFIYKWHPLQIGELRDGKLEITQEHPTPAWFQHMRGSSNVVHTQGYYWMIIHGVQHTRPRQYFHQVILLDENTFELKRYSLPFYFQKLAIEYCLGLDIQGSEGKAFVSANDASPFVCTFSLDSLVWMSGIDGAV